MFGDMLLHIRRVIVVGPDVLRVVAFSPAQDWKREMPIFLKDIGKGATGHSYVVLAARDALDSVLQDRSDVFRCPACEDLKECSVYENQCERIADSLSLLSICQRGDGQWAWLAPEQVIELSRVAVDPEVDLKMRVAIGIKMDRGGLKDSLFGILNEELESAKGFMSAARGRLKKKVAATAGNAAGRAVDDVIDNVVNIGASTFRQKFKAATNEQGSGGREGDRESAASVLGVDAHASNEDVDAAWRKMAQRFHPDKNPGEEAWASQRMAEINKAREKLKS